MERIIGRKQLTFVQFYTTLCWTCLHWIRSTLVQLAQEMKDTHHGLVRIGSFNCKKSPDVCQKYGVRKYPSFLTFEQGTGMDKRNDRNRKSREFSTAVVSSIFGRNFDKKFAKNFLKFAE